MSNTAEVIDVEIATERLSSYISPEYKWPTMPQGWQLEFIVYPDGDVVMDFLHPVSCSFWSDDNGELEVPIQHDNTPITVGVLIKAGIPYMTTFGQAAVSEEPKDLHLKAVK